MPLLARRFSITNFLIATSALSFQVFVLYPWHMKLDDDFAELRKENMRMVKMLERRYNQSAERVGQTSKSMEQRSGGVMKALEERKGGMVTA
jgi:hypothetical protein